MAVKRAALYIRVSTDEQARHGYSLGEQKADLESYAERNNYAVVDIYADEGVSARKPMRHRRELQRLLADVEQGLIDVIVIKCLDRWFRNIADFYKVKEKLDACKVDWECTQEKYNTTTTEGRLMLNLKLSIAQNESDQTSDRIKYINEGKRRRKEVPAGNIALGYSLDKDRHLVPDENAPIVKEIFEHVAAGNSSRSAISLVSSKHNLKLSFRQIQYMLTNRTYLGEYHDITDFCPPIIPRPLFDKVQDIIARRFRSPQKGCVYLFRGLIRCPYCGRLLLAHQVYGQYAKNSSPQYRCPKSSADRDCEFCGIVSERKLEKWLLANIQNLLRQEVYEIDCRRRKNGVDYQAKLASVKNKLERLKDLYLDGLIDKTAYRKDYELLTGQEREYTSLSLKSTRAIPAAILRVIECDNLSTIYDELSQNARQSFWQSIIKEITFDHEKIPGHIAKKTYHVKFLL